MKKLNIEVPETIDNRQEAFINRRVQQEETKEVVVEMIKSEMLSNSIYEQQSHWINQTTNNGANLYLYSAYYVSIVLTQLLNPDIKLNLVDFQKGQFGNHGF